METLKKRWQDLPLRRFLILTVCISISMVALASVLIIGGCVAFRHWLLPDPDAVYLTIEETFTDGTVNKSTYLMDFGADLSFLPFEKIEYDGVPIIEDIKQTRYSVEKIETGMDSLSPKRKLAYQICGMIIFAAPTVLAFVAILLCCMYFYRRKLKVPLSVLADATKQIAGQNLDFELVYPCRDEMGELCRSFEDMRATLCENNKIMWNMLDERRLMQASVAHDLRNPIAIIEGYTEYLEKGFKSGEMSREKTIRIVQNLGAAAKRLEQYTESVRLLNQTEEAQLERKSVDARKLLEDISEDLSLLSEQKGISLQVTGHMPQEEIQVDSALLYRVLENILSNGLRYAKRKIQLAYTLEEQMLMITITDDGKGFSPEILNETGNKLFTTGKDGHMGIGLSVSRLLCRKHGGKLELSNTSGGACVKISLSV